MSENSNIPSMKPVEASEFGKTAPALPGPKWVRTVGFTAILMSAITFLTGLFLGWWVKGIAETPVSPVMELGGYFLTFMPFVVLTPLILATIAGIPRGQSRRLALIAGIVTFLSLPAFLLLAAFVPIRA